jgi:hypothetical protein
MYKDYMADYLWFQEIDDLDKSEEILEEIEDIAAFNMACAAVYTNASVCGLSPYTHLILERSTYRNVGSDFCDAILLQYCQLRDIGKYTEAHHFLDKFGYEVKQRLNLFLEEVDINKPLTPQLTILKE